MSLTLIGYRGSGKTTVAAPLADALGWDWIDADVEIERRAGKSIREIFDAGGEPAFRTLEREVLADLLSRESLVIAAGGGAVLDAGTRQAMRNAGPVIWLTADVDTLLARIHTDASTAERRPNLTSTGGREEVEQLLQQREPLYRECATITIDTAAASLDDIVARILDEIRPAQNAE